MSCTPNFGELAHENDGTFFCWATSARRFRITMPPFRTTSSRFDQRPVKLGSPVPEDREIHPLIPERPVGQGSAHHLLSLPRCLRDDLAVAGDEHAPARAPAIRRRAGGVAAEDVDEVLRRPGPA